MQKPAWAGKIVRAHRKRSQIQILQNGIQSLARAKRDPKAIRRYAKLALDEHPFDSHLLELSSLYRKSRSLFRGAAGNFKKTLVSSPRTLSAVALLSSEIEFSPIERELVWSATDPLQVKDPAHLLALREYTTSIYHEQNHRIIWSWLPRIPKKAADVRRYLNFAESLVVTLDMALGDELGPELAEIFHYIGVTYDPGTTVRAECPSRRVYRNYLQAAMHATYLHLEHFEDKEIARIIRAMFPLLGPFAERAAHRATRLDRQFVDVTNPSWQEKHSHQAVRILSLKQKGEPMVLPSGPDHYADNRLQYLFAESVFGRMGL